MIKAMFTIYQMAFRTETQAAIQCRISNNSTKQLEQVVHTHPTLCCAPAERLDQRVLWINFQSSLLNIYFSPQLVGSSNRPYLFTSAMVQILHTESKRGYNPISTWHSPFEIRFALTEIVLKSPYLFEQNLFPVRFSCQRKTYPEKCEHCLSEM